MWQILFQTFENPEHTEGVNAQGSAASQGGENSANRPSLGPDGTPAETPKDDKAKEAKAHHEEHVALTDLLSEHGPDRFREEFWHFMGPDFPDLLMLKFLRARKVSACAGGPELTVVS